MSTRAIIRFATRESGVSFSDHPKQWHAQLFCRLDGHPESLGVDIANSISNRCFIPHNLEIDSLDTKRGDLDYVYYIWQHFDKSTWISIFEATEAYCPTCGHPEPEGGERMYECIFVGEPEDLQKKINKLTNIGNSSRAVGNWNGDKITCVDVEDTN
tara:strand:+ start:1497 stop:1967 length:471 start_codon:yes stop_codon:yes gene_type:complete